jgi:hypothetical protein
MAYLPPCHNRLPIIIVDFEPARLLKTGKTSFAIIGMRRAQSCFLTAKRTTIRRIVDQRSHPFSVCLFDYPSGYIFPRKPTISGEVQSAAPMNFRLTTPCRSMM